MISSVIVSSCWLPILPPPSWEEAQKARPGLSPEKMLQSVAVVLESKSESCTDKLLYAAES